MADSAIQILQLTKTHNRKDSLWSATASYSSSPRGDKHAEGVICQRWDPPETWTIYNQPSPPPRCLRESQRLLGQILWWLLRGIPTRTLGLSDRALILLEPDFRSSLINKEKLKSGVWSWKAPNTHKEKSGRTWAKLCEFGCVAPGQFPGESNATVLCWSEVLSLLIPFQQACAQLGLWFEISIFFFSDTHPHTHTHWGPSLNICSIHPDSPSHTSPLSAQETPNSITARLQWEVGSAAQVELRGILICNMSSKCIMGKYFYCCQSCNTDKKKKQSQGENAALSVLITNEACREISWEQCTCGAATHTHSFLPDETIWGDEGRKGEARAAGLK